MSLFGSILCAFDRHKPVRKTVHWDGFAYIGECRRCGAPIHRLAHRTWRRRKPVPRGDETPAT